MRCPGHQERTVQATTADGAHQVDSCLAREILDRIGDKWSVYVIDALAAGTRRFSELRRDVDGVSQRMLTVTLRGLERDGLIVRQVYPVIPPKVEYSLTPLGRSLLAIVDALVAWSGDHITEVERARRRYDTRPRDAASRAAAVRDDTPILDSTADT